MGGVLALFGGADENRNLLRLQSRLSMPADIRRSVNRELAVEAGRVQVQTTRMRGVEYGGQVAMQCVTSITKAAELAAGECPEERARVDGVADTVAVTIARLVAELGQ